MITEVTRKNIIDELRLNNIVWNGRLSEIEFLKRLYPLHLIESSDVRFDNMENDIWQHRINNYDWDDLWVFTDKRLHLTEEEPFLNFLCEMIHPVVRSTETDQIMLVKIFNTHLVKDGWKLVEKNKTSGRSVFIAVSANNQVVLDIADKISNDFIQEQLKKCEEKIGKGDYDGAMSSARSLVESTFADIYQRVTGETLEKGGDLLKKYKKINPLLNLSEEKYSHNEIKSMMKNLSGIVSSLDFISNEMGDRHTRPVKPQKHHARLCVNIAKSLVGFLYDVLEYKFGSKENILEDLLKVLDSDIRSLEGEELLTNKEVKRVYSRTDQYIRCLLKDKLINEYEINSFRKSDIFKSAIEILSDVCRENDIKKIFEKHASNPQAVRLQETISFFYRKSPDWITQKMKVYLKNNSCQKDTIY